MKIKNGSKRMAKKLGGNTGAGWIKDGAVNPAPGSRYGYYAANGTVYVSGNTPKMSGK
jgi:hypothetical protein